MYLVLLQSLGLRTPGQVKTPRVLERNKENISHLPGNTPSGALRSQDTQDHTFTINSVAGSYMEFAVNVAPKVFSSYFVFIQ